MKKTLSLVFLAITILSFTGCDVLTGEEIGRLPINKVSTNNDNLIIKEISLDLKKGEEIAIWSDMDIEYEGAVEMRFKIEVLKDGEKIDFLEINPTKKNVTIGEVEISLMDKTKWSFLGKNSTIKIKDDGNYTFKGIFVTSENPSFKVKKAEVVFKK